LPLIGSSISWKLLLISVLACALVSNCSANMEATSISANNIGGPHIRTKQQVDGVLDQSMASVSNPNGSTDAPEQCVGLQDLAAPHGFKIIGRESDTDMGYAITSAGDVNGDQRSDLLISSPRTAYDLNRPESGIVFVLFGQNYYAEGQIVPDIDLQNINVGVQGIRIFGASTSTQIGRSVAALDIDGDNINDIVVSAEQTTESNAVVYVIFGSLQFHSDIDLSGTISGGIWTILGPELSAGNNPYTVIVSSGGDVNGDNRDDLLIGAPNVDYDVIAQCGAVYVLFGAASSTYTSSLQLNEGWNYDIGAIIYGSQPYEQFGRALAAADVNLDGYSDLLLGSSNVLGDGDDPSSGAVYVIYGSSSVQSMQPGAFAFGYSTGFKLMGDSQSGLGHTVSALGDINADGFADFAMTTVTGAVYVVYGGYGDTRPAEAFISTVLGSSGFQIVGADTLFDGPISISRAGDLDQNGFSDLVLGFAIASVDGNHVGAGGRARGVWPSKLHDWRYFQHH